MAKRLWRDLRNKARLEAVVGVFALGSEAGEGGAGGRKWEELGKREAQWSFCAIPCSVTQAHSGSRRQEKLAWKYRISPRGRGFQTIPKSGFVLFFFSPSLSFFLFLSPQAVSPARARWQIFQLHPAHPNPRSHSFPFPGSGKGSQEGTRWHTKGQSQPAQHRRSRGGLWGKPGLEAGLWESGAARAHIPPADPQIPPDRAGAHSQARPQPRLGGKEPSRELGGGSGRAQPGDAHRHPWNGWTLPERSSTNSGGCRWRRAQAQMFPSLAGVKRLLTCQKLCVGGLLDKVGAR